MVSIKSGAGNHILIPFSKHDRYPQNSNTHHFPSNISIIQSMMLIPSFYSKHKQTLLTQTFLPPKNISTIEKSTLFPKWNNGRWLVKRDVTISIAFKFMPAERKIEVIGQGQSRVLLEFLFPKNPVGKAKGNRQIFLLSQC